jgi:hypothetical protein
MSRYRRPSAPSKSASWQSQSPTQPHTLPTFVLFLPSSVQAFRIPSCSRSSENLGSWVIAVNSNILEFTLGDFGPWFWGSDRKTQGAFTDIQYLGTVLQRMGAPRGSPT